MDNKNKRITLFDYAKGLLIILVVLGHIMPGDLFWTGWICSFHVPAFFLINGMLLSYNRYTERPFFQKNGIVLQGIKKILCPYFAFALLLLLTRWAFAGFTIENLRWQLIDLLSLWGIGANWFLPCLFFAQIIYYFIKKSSLYIQSKFKFLNCHFILMLFSLILFIITLFKYDFVLVKVIYRALIAVFFISFGNCMLPIILNFKKQKLYVKFITTIISFSLSIFLFIITGKPCAQLYLLIINNPIIYILSALIGSAFIISLISIIDDLNDKNLIAKILNFYGTESLNIMGTHQILMLIMFIPIKNNYLLNVLFCILILIAEIPVVFLIRKIKKYSIQTKNRR
jgi:fucose 4-O-acetylase-like acetyltransferase